jgi:hypothetical protein
MGEIVVKDRAIANIEDACDDDGDNRRGNRTARRQVAG